MAKYEAFVKPFRGRDDDLTVFWSKYDVFAKIQKFSKEAALQNLPLFLDGEAYLVWDQLPEHEKKDLNKVKAALDAAFTISKSQAYRLFSSRQLRSDESVDAYAADLRRLLMLSGQHVDDANVVVIEQFLQGLPKEFAKQVRMHASLESINDCVGYVRRLRGAEDAANVGPRREVVAAVPSRSGTSRTW